MPRAKDVNFDLIENELTNVENKNLLIKLKKKMPFCKNLK